MKKSEVLFLIISMLIGAIGILLPPSASQTASLALAAAIAAVPELVKMGAGLGQKIKSNRLIKNNKRPTLNYPVPQEYYDNMMAAKNMAGVSGLPGQGHIENRMDAQGANAISLASQTQQSPAAIMAGVSSMSNNLMGAEADLGVKGAEFKAKNLAQYFAANEQLAGAEINKFNNDWDWNHAQPYLSAMSAASALREGGAQNAFSGLEGLSSLATSFFADKLKNAAPAASEGEGAEKYPGTPPFVPTLQYPDTWLDSSRVDNAPDLGFKPAYLPTTTPATTPAANVSSREDLLKSKYASSPNKGTQTYEQWKSQIFNMRDWNSNGVPYGIGDVSDSEWNRMLKDYKW